MSSNTSGELSSVTTKPSRMRWVELILLLPMLLLLPFAFYIVCLVVVRCIQGLFDAATLSSDALWNSVAHGWDSTRWEDVMWTGFFTGGAIGGVTIAVVVMLSTETLQRRRWLSRWLAVGLLPGVVVALVILWVLGRELLRAEATLLGWLTILSIALIPLLLTARHLPRLLRAACFAPVTPPSPPVPHVQ